ncbi:MAG TPA: hypothetical protein PLX83_16930 [bacterium]|nr:hypothetical protein [bacterium]
MADTIGYYTTFIKRDFEAARLPNGNRVVPVYAVVGNQQVPYAHIVYDQNGKPVDYVTYTEQPNFYFIKQFGLWETPYTYNGEKYMNMGGGAIRVEWDEKQGKWIPLSQDLISKFKADWEDVKARNEQRYADILAGYEKLYGETENRLSGLGLQQAKDIDTSFQRAAAKAKQDLTSRGLVNTTILPSVMTGYEKERVAAQNRLAEDLTRERLGYLTDITKQKLDFMERKNETYPNLEYYTIMLQNLGKGGL